MIDAWVDFICILSCSVINVPINETDHAKAAVVHCRRKTSQLEASTNDILHIILNAGSVRDMHLLVYLTALCHDAFYSPRHLAEKVNMRDIALPGVLVPRKQRPSKKKSNGKMKVELNDRHTACYGKDKFLMNMLRAAVVPSSS